jgi:AraC family transcriptional regulator
VTNPAEPPVACVPRFENKPLLVLVGLQRHYQTADTSGIPHQWGAFVPLIERIFERVSEVAYGICINTSEVAFDYFCGVEVPASSAQRPEFTTLVIPAQRYAVFAHHGRVERIVDTVHWIFTQWLPNSSCVATSYPTLLERYSEDFEPVSNSGSVEIWIPIRAVG